VATMTVEESDDISLGGDPLVGVGADGRLPVSLQFVSRCGEKWSSRSVSARNPAISERVVDVESAMTRWSERVGVRMVDMRRRACLPSRPLAAATLVVETGDEISIGGDPAIRFGADTDLQVSLHSTGRNGERLSARSVSAQNPAITGSGVEYESATPWCPRRLRVRNRDMPCGAYPP